MYYNSPDFHAVERNHRAGERRSEDLSRRRNDGSEALRAKPLPPRAKALFALAALVINGGLAVLAYRAGFTIAAVILTAIAVLMLIDLGWQRHKMNQENARDRHG